MYRMLRPPDAASRAPAHLALLLAAIAASMTARPPTETTGGLPVTATWQWQLQGDVNTGYDVDVYDIDLFDSPTELIESLHSDGRSVICYFSAGSLESFRPDAGVFARSAVGNPVEGWAGEYWLDVRDASVRMAIDARLDLAVDKGCDGVEPDNVDGYTNDSGFDLSAADQLDFNRFVANEAHERGLLVALKNALDLVPALVDSFDFAVNEQCFEFDECDALQPFLDAGKPVFEAEYAASLRGDHDGVVRRGPAAWVAHVDPPTGARRLVPDLVRSVTVSRTSWPPAHGRARCRSARGTRAARRRRRRGALRSARRRRCG